MSDFNENPSLSSVTDLTLEQFSFTVPTHLIAQEPNKNREESLLLQRLSDGTLSHHQVFDLTELLPKDCLLVLNQTKVLPSRIKWYEGTKEFELFLLSPPAEQEDGTCLVRALGRPLAKLRKRSQIQISDAMIAEVVAVEEEPFAHLLLKFSLNKESFLVWLEKHAFMPLPPYIKRKNTKTYSESPDRLSYQTEFSEDLGSVAAPTAGLHFSRKLLSRLTSLGIEIAKLTLHVGAQTFQPVRASYLKDHKMHQENYRISQDDLTKIVEAKKAGRKIVVVGTTSLRALESLFLKAKAEGEDVLTYGDRWLSTDLFIYPKEELYKPYFCDALITNFHQSKSTLFILVCALIGRSAAFSMYEEALAKEYPFHSYGACSLLWL